MTASRALNHSGYVSQSVRQGVLRAAAKLDYRPNMVARQLRSQRLSAIGVLLPDIANPFSAELVNGRKLVLTNPDTALSLLYPAAALSRRPQAFELL
jgi:DNA-binding LacI/PurR family transcriptional regulator